MRPCTEVSDISMGNMYRGVLTGDRGLLHILLKNMSYFGIENSEAGLSRNYVDNSEQCVRVNNEDSVDLNVTCNVPQGRILGPLKMLKR